MNNPKCSISIRSDSIRAYFIYLCYLRSAAPEVLILDKKLRRIFSLDLPSNWHNWRGNQMPFFLQTIYFRIKLMLQYIGCILFPCLLKSQFSRSFFLPIRNFKVNSRVNWLYLNYFLFSITSLECLELGFWRSVNSTEWYILTFWLNHIWFYKSIIFILLLKNPF